MIPPVTTYTISPGTPETANYDPARFVVMGDGPEPLIMSWGPAWGWIKRDDISPARLAEHLADMRRDGFIITTATA